ncbi:50S ribosomal protein L23 [Candidatus Saccharibacteria bacterium SW_7_54_9]|nr:MAG: 50S ribosomal protein L23 [Candidatus Saccharibacteria bacterium SW_7_54_9]
MIVRPVISEKAIAQTDEENTYLFYVPLSANKHTIAREVARRFDVTVTGVRTAILKGKSKGVPVRRGRKLISGRRDDMKKAYVTLGEGDSISMFEGSE